MSSRRLAAILRAWHAAAVGVTVWIIAPLAAGALLLWALGCTRAVPAFAHVYRQDTPAVLLVITWCVGFLTLLVFFLLVSRRGRTQ